MNLPTQSAIEAAGVEHAYDGTEHKQAFSGSKEALTFEAGAYWMQTQMLKLNPDKLNKGPVKDEGEAPAGIPVKNWMYDAADEIARYVDDSPCWTHEEGVTAIFGKIILKHAPKEDPAPELTIFKQQEGEIIEQRQTIAMLTQQLCDKKEIIRRLTT